MNSFELTFLGTCAYDYSNKLENEFKDCFDKDARRASSLLINGKYLIDCGPHALDSLRIIGKNKDEITDLFVTHTHCDHFDMDNICKLAKNRHSPLRIWVKKGARLDKIENAQIMEMKPFEKYTIDDITITGMNANHDKGAHPQHLLIERNGDKMLYGCDGGWLLNDTYNSLWNAHLTLCVLDCTVGDYNGDFRIAEHNSIPMLRLMLPALKTIGAIDENTKIYLSHIAPSLHKPHAEIEKVVKELGAYVAFDGAEVKI